MKKLIQSLSILLVGVFLNGKTMAQYVPSGVTFQGIATDSKGNIAANATVYVKDAIIRSTANGTVVYSETFSNLKTSADGVFTIVIGQGEKSSVSPFNAIDWSNGPYFLNLQVAIKPSTTSVSKTWVPTYYNLGTQQFWSVPYAFQAGSVSGMDKKLNVADTASMLSKYYKSSNPAGYITSSAITGKLNISDTANMLSTYYPLANPAGFITSSAITGKLNISDTANMLSTYYPLANPAGYITSTDITSKLNVSDTAAMLSNYLNGIKNAVPYTGATADVDLGSNKITASSIALTGGTNTKVLLGDGSLTASGTNGQVLTISGSTPVWGNSLPNAVLGVLASDATVQSLSQTYSGGTSPKYTGAYINLPPGKWAVNIVMLSNCHDNNGSITSGNWWLRFGFSTSSTEDIDQTYSSSEFPINKLVSGATLANDYGVVQGTIVINNASGNIKTYYLWTANCDLSRCDGTSIINRLAYSGNGENLIFALPMYY